MPEDFICQAYGLLEVVVSIILGSTDTFEFAGQILPRNYQLRRTGSSVGRGSSENSSYPPHTTALGYEKAHWACHLILIIKIFLDVY